ncbi:MAG: cell division protein FtsA [Alphaproteobacteria bacterium]|jgi:cell division protein FtsA
MRSLKNKFVTVLDIGTSKICGLTAKVSLDHDSTKQNISIIACASLPAQGIIGGEINDLPKVEAVITTLIETLETKSNQRIDAVWINASTGCPKTEYKDMKTDIKGYINAGHISDLQNQVIDSLRSEQKYIMHAIPVDYEVDGSPVKQPIGMKAQQLKVQMVLITGKLSQLRNLGISVERAHVEISGRVAMPIASALGCLDETEKANGAICIDIGSETISICAFSKNVPFYVDVLKMGSNYITKDIARAFGISTENAEIIKKNHGSCIPNINDEKETLELPIIGADYDITGFENRPKSHLTQIIAPRCEEMLEAVRDHLKQLGILHPTYRIVLTGGGSSLDGIEKMATTIFKMRPRIACPLLSVTLPQHISSPEYVSLIGLLTYSLGGLNELPAHQLFSKLRTQKGFTGKVLNWLVQNF